MKRMNDKDYEIMLLEHAKAVLEPKILKCFTEVPKTVIVLGSGLNLLKERMLIKTEIPYNEIPGFNASSVVGHGNSLLVGEYASTPIIAMNGRFHYYEGYGMDDIAFPIKLFKTLGVETLILSAAVGSTSLDIQPGEIMVVTDHIKFFDENPLRGQNNDMLGTRFPDMSSVYKTLKGANYEEFKSYIQDELGLTYHEGTYAFMPGPSYETPAEVKALKMLGADVVGMSTVPEAITANYCGMNVYAFAAISNFAAGVTDQPLNHEEVIENGKVVADAFAKIIAKLLDLMKVIKY